MKLFPLPKNFPDANLNTATFDRKGILWFTGQNGVYGRVDPATGKVEAWKAPKGVGPYGITTTPNGDVWYASLAGDHIAKIDTVSGDALMVPPPQAGVGPRRIWSDSKGLLWVSFWHSGEVGRFDPIAKAWKVWSLPKSSARLLRGLCRRQGQGLAVRLAGQRARALRSGDGKIRQLPEQPQPRRRAPDPRPPGRSCGPPRAAPTGWWWCGNERGDRAARRRCDGWPARRPLPAGAGQSRAGAGARSTSSSSTRRRRPACRSASISFRARCSARATEAYTLIGGPRRPEKFVVRDDAFDCVTFCETVLAGGDRARPGEFEEGCAPSAITTAS